VDGGDGRMPQCKGSGLGEIRGLIFLLPRFQRERWELTFSEFDCGSQIDVDRSKRRCIFVGWRPAIIGLKVFFVPCAGRLASPIFHGWMTLSIYRWIALPKALGFSNPCTASSFTARRAMSRWNPNEPIPNGDHVTRRTETARAVVGERADRRRVSEAENFFRCNICGGYLDARDYVWVLDHEGPLPHPPQDQVQ
jgi:hypothetical protein